MFTGYVVVTLLAIAANGFRGGVAPHELRSHATRAFERLVSPTVQVMNSTCQPR
jgi:hypothetical protein